MGGKYSMGAALLVAAIGLPLLAAAQAPSPIQLRTAAQEGSEPKFLAAGNGQIVGLCIDIMRAVEQLDPGLRFVGDQQWKPLIRANAELASGLADVACALQRTPEREKIFHYFGPALYTIDYHFLVRSDDDIAIRNWNDVRDLGPGAVVLVNRGYAAGEILAAMGGFTVDASSPRAELNLHKLIAGRGRLYFHRGPGLTGLLERTGTADKVKILPQVMYSAKLYFAASKQLDSKARDRLAAALFVLEKKGELERLMRKWD
ncbi:transporter substrate-binding domain-containing protein [Pseudoduganella sp. FT26W]|uniref:Transporter substrate-binding domain-containing protein n=1 Tax=Duganella aquatilis TaxID=2666082 RepID=A0A844CSD1_9BURK|nr:transporter substrate-binding domain-containing protein [Duganella aquatilis]MRW83213.1 transporter substrate-binding domain-containing protein [Duganella aquatilis]